MTGSTTGPPVAPTVGVVTIACDRRPHLEAQAASIARQTMAPDRYVVVDMGGPDPGPVVRSHWPDAVIVECTGRPGDLPLAQARNVGSAVADTDVTIFLDVDCVATPTLVHDYVAHVVERSGVHAGPVGYLPPGTHDLSDVADLTRRSVHQRGRPQPGQRMGQAQRHEMFWSLSFAVDRQSWKEIGGFDERFVGYGGEDTDFARTAFDRGIPLWFHGDAAAFHQFHPTSSPPTQHLEAICRNATAYHDKWAEWPMSGWLAAFADASLIRWTPEASSIVVTDGMPDGVELVDHAGPRGAGDRAVGRSLRSSKPG